MGSRIYFEMVTILKYATIKPQMLEKNYHENNFIERFFSKEATMWLKVKMCYGCAESSDLIKYQVLKQICSSIMQSKIANLQSNVTKTIFKPNQSPRD